jgi:two-component system phosphate regulon sensor histidine kinase PhoR
VIGVLAQGGLGSALEEQLAATVRAHAVLLLEHARDDFAGLDRAAVQHEVKALADANGVRITFIRRDGTVVLDTQHSPDTMEDHRGRIEVQEALVRGEGRSARRSRTLDHELFYIAVVEDPGAGRNGVVRAALPLEDVQRQLSELRRSTLFGALLAALAALAIGAWMARRITAPVAELTRVAESMRQGEYEARIAAPGRDELGVLAAALNRMGGEVTQRIARLTSDEARLRAMLAGMVEGVVAVDEFDRISFTNRAARDLLAMPKRGAEGRRLWEVARVSGLAELVSAARDSDSAAQAELTLVQAGGERLVQSTAHRFVADDRIGVVVVFADVTELRRLERVRQDFVANVSHELKTPLTSIRGYVETLLDGALHDERNNARFLEKIDANVQRLHALVIDLLSLARIETQEGGLALAQVDWRRLLQASVRRAETLSRRRGVHVRVELDGDNFAVLGDEESLTQVVDNLLDNALKYTPEGGTVSARLEAQEDTVTLSVRDTGIGIPHEDQERIFERFYRVDRARSREVGGTGLGLSIVKHLVQAMQGEIALESEPGDGSCFTVRIPRP